MRSLQGFIRIWSRFRSISNGTHHLSSMTRFIWLCTSSGHDAMSSSTDFVQQTNLLRRPGNLADKLTRPESSHYNERIHHTQLRPQFVFPLEHNNSKGSSTAAGSQLNIPPQCDVQCKILISQQPVLHF